MYPNRYQLKLALAKANESISNTFIMNTKAQFEVIPTNEIISGYEYVHHFRNCDPNDLYVGKKASEDDRYLDEIMNEAEDQWMRFIRGEIPAYPLAGQENISFNLSDSFPDIKTRFFTGNPTKDL
ncbi:MAG: hypothetical protein PHC56_05800 [Herbinix sp.]|nr:hypothetical protein [Herbinix sp.]